MKRIIAAVPRDIPSLRQQLNPVAGSSLPGLREVEELVHAGTAIVDDRGRLHPQLAESIPSTEDGSWEVLPDGTMRTTWRLNANARWQDGAPVTGDDFVFTVRVGQDHDLPFFHHVAYDSVQRATAPDQRTVVVEWSKPYIDADKLFANWIDIPSLPLPEHLLKQPYEDNKAGFAELRYWSDDFVGAGPFKVGEWVRGSHLILNANDAYVLGRPKVDSIEVRIVVATEALSAGLLSGQFDLPLGRQVFSIDEALQLRDQWSDGRVEMMPDHDIKLWPQLRNPTPAIIADVQFRRAILTAIDRQQMVDTLMQGLSSVAYSILSPGDPEFEPLQPSVVRYEFDPRKASQMIEGLGYTKGSDGMYRDAAGTRLELEMRTVALDILQKTDLSVSDDLQRIGVVANPVFIPPQRQGDNEYRATFPAFDTSRANAGVRSFIAFHSSQSRTAETRYVGSNYSGYSNPDFDALIERYYATIPLPERMSVAGQIIHHMTDQVLAFDLFYDVTPTATGNRLRNVPTKVSTDYAVTWNAQDWDVQ